MELAAEDPDWPALLKELQDKGWSVQMIARDTGIPKATLMGYRTAGSEPPYSKGCRLIALWWRVVGRWKDAG